MLASGFRAASLLRSSPSCCSSMPPLQRLRLRSLTVNATCLRMLTSQTSCDHHGPPPAETFTPSVQSFLDIYEHACAVPCLDVSVRSQHPFYPRKSDQDMTRQYMERSRRDTALRPVSTTALVCMFTPHDMKDAKLNCITHGMFPTPDIFDCTHKMLIQHIPSKLRPIGRAQAH